MVAIHYIHTTGVYMYICIYIYVCICVCEKKHTYIHLISTQIHTHTQMCTWMYSTILIWWSNEEAKIVLHLNSVHGASLFIYNHYYYYYNEK